MAKITYAGTASRSFAEGSVLLDKLADWPVPEKQVERVTRRIGAERVAERDAETAAFAALPLVEKFAVPAGVTAPELAVVMADGGRLQIRDEPGTGVAASRPPGSRRLAWRPRSGWRNPPRPRGRVTGGKTKSGCC